LEVDLLTEEELVLVTTDLETYQASGPSYVHVEWGPDFSLHHAVSFPDSTPSLVANLGPLALNYVLLEGGSGYFRKNAVRRYLEAGTLHLVPRAPHFSFPVYAVHSVDVDVDTLGIALTVLRAVSTKEVQ
jgi:hypothetical protein